MDSDAFVDEIQHMFDTPFRTCIDWKAYMRGESEDVTDYFFSKETCFVRPSEAEINSAHLCSGRLSEPFDKDGYVAQHTKEMIVLDKSSENGIFGNRMVTVADVENNRILKVPFDCVTFK